MGEKRKPFGHWGKVIGNESDSMQSNFNWLSSHTHLIHPAFYIITIKLGKKQDIPFSILHMQPSKQKSFEGRRSFVSNAKPVFSWQIIAGLAHFPAELTLVTTSTLKTCQVTAYQLVFARLLVM